LRFIAAQPNVWDTLSWALNDEDPSVQGAAMGGLLRLAARNPGLREDLTTLALEGYHAASSPRRNISIELLRQLRTPGHRERCLAAIDDPDSRVRQRAIRGLRY
jgi:hypothetical protein